MCQCFLYLTYSKGEEQTINKALKKMENKNVFITSSLRPVKTISIESTALI